MTAPRRRRGRPPGRRPGDSSTRDALLDAARVQFAERGYEAATLRGIAEAAGVDAAMIKHHFGSKEGLFAASVELPFEPAEFVERVVEGQPEDVGHRLATRFVTMWDSAGGAGAQSMLRSAMQNEQVLEQVRTYYTQHVLRRAISVLMEWDEEAALRANLVASQLLGLLLARYIGRFEPIASMPAERLIEAIAPTLQRYLLGPLPPA